MLVKAREGQHFHFAFSITKATQEVMTMPRLSVRLFLGCVLLPAGIAVYVQRGPNGVGLETGYSVGLEGFTSQSERSEPNRERPSS